MPENGFANKASWEVVAAVSMGLMGHMGHMGLMGHMGHMGLMGHVPCRFVILEGQLKRLPP